MDCDDGRALSRGSAYRSRMVTVRPLAERSSPAARPATPAPMMVTSDVLMRSCARWRSMLGITRTALLRALRRGAGFCAARPEPTASGLRLQVVGQVILLP